MAKKTISNTFTVNTIEDGTSPYLLNLTNEMESIACDDQGTPYLINGQRQTASTNFNFFVGNSRVRPTRVTVEHNGFRLTSGVMMDGFLATWTTSGITIEFYQSYQTEGGTVTVKYDGTPLKFDIIGVFPQQSDGVSVLAAATFAVVPIKGTALYRIVPSTDQIVKHADGTYTPDGNITCEVVKCVGNEMSNPLSSEYTLTMKIDDDDNEVSYAATDVSTIESKIEYFLYVGSESVADKETIPVVVDGQSVSTLDIDNEYDGVPTDSTGKILAAKTVQTIVRLYKGSTEIDISSVSVNTTGGISVTGMPVNTVATFTPSAEGGGGKGKKLSWAFNANETMSDKYNVAISYTNRGTEYKATFTINASKGQAVFNLKPSYSALPCTRNASTGALNNPPALSLQVEVTDTNKPVVLSSFDNNGAVTYNNTKYYVRYSTSSMPTAGNAGTKWPSGNSLQALTTDNNIYIALFTTNNSSGVLLDRETVPIVKDGEDGEDGEDAHEINPNILLRTVFNNGLDFVKEAWESDWNYTGIDTATDTIIEGRKSIRINAVNASSYVDFKQNVYGRMKTGTWYTLSFYYFATQAFNTFIYSNSDSYACIDQSAGIYIDGVLQSNVPINGNVQWASNWQGNRHTITFKTKSSSFSTTYFYIIFRAQIGGQVAVCMPKLEIGEYATAYMANEEDLEGKDAATVVVTPSQVLFNAKSNGKASSTQYFTLNYGLYVNNVVCSVDSPDKVTLSLPTNVNLNGNKGKSSSQIYITDDTAVSTGAIIQISIEGTLSGKTYNASTSIPVAGVRTGADGSRGKVGRAYYYAGEWNELADSFTVVVNDAQAPFFGYKPSGSTYGYYVLVRDQNGTFTKSQIYTDCGNPVAQSANWSKMADDQEYIITKAIFGDYAQFGGSIINQDWLTSVHGDVNVAWRRNTKIESYTSISAGNIYSPTWIGQFYAKTTGTHKFYINYECNGSPFTIILWDRSVESNNSIFSQYISSDGGAVNTSPYLYSGHQYLLCAYKSSSSNPNPVITNATMDTPVPSGSTFPTGNYLYLDPMTGGAETILSDNEITVSTNSSISYQTIVAYDMPLASLSSYYFYFELKGSDTTSRYVYWYLDRKENGSWVQRFSSDNNSRFTVNKADWTEYKFNLGFDSNAGGQYRLRIYASSSTVIMRKVSVAAGASFAPQFGVDLYRGTVSMNNVHVRGTVDAIDGEFHGTVYAKDGVFNGTVYAKDGEFNGIVKTKLFYAGVKKLEIETYTVNLSTEPYYTYFCMAAAGGATIVTLPTTSANSVYEGVELRFFVKRLSFSNSHYARVRSSSKIFYQTSGGTLGYLYEVTLKDNRFSTFKAMNDGWYAMDDGVIVPSSNAPSIEPEDQEIDEQV